MAQNIIMPKQGLQMTEGTIVKWYVKEGGLAVKGKPLFQIETDKVTIDIDSQYDGTLIKLLYTEGDTVPIAQVIAVIGDAGETAPLQKAPEMSSPTATETPKLENPSVSQKAEIPKPVKETPKPLSLEKRLFATPRAKKTALENGIDIKAITGSINGLIIERDVTGFNEKLVYKNNTAAPVTYVKYALDLKNIKSIAAHFKEDAAASVTRITDSVGHGKIRCSFFYGVMTEVFPPVVPGKISAAFCLKEDGGECTYIAAFTDDIIGGINSIQLLEAVYFCLQMPALAAIYSEEKYIEKV